MESTAASAHPNASLRSGKKWKAADRNCQEAVFERFKGVSPGLHRVLNPADKHPGINRLDLLEGAGVPFAPFPRT